MTKTQKRWLIGTGVAVGLLVAYVVEERVRGGWALRSWENRMRAAGQRLTVPEVREPVPNDPAVRTLTPSQAASFLGVAAGPRDAPSAMMVVAPGRARCVSRMDSWPDDDGKEHTWSELAPMVAGYREALAELRPTLTNRAFFVVIDYDQGFNLLLPHLARYKGLAQGISAAALLALHERNLGEVTAHLACFPALAEAGQREHFLIGDLVALAVAQIGMNVTWEALQHEGWTDAQLAAIQAVWERPAFLEPMARALEMERALGAMYFNRSRYSAGDVFRLVGALGPMALGASGTTGSSRGAWWVEWLEPLALLGQQARNWVGMGLWSVAWREQDQLYHSRMIQAWVDKARTAAAQRHFAAPPPEDANADDVWTGRGTSEGPGAMRYWLSRMLVPSLEKASAKAAYAEAFRELVLTACALKRHQIRYGRLPETLEALVPEFRAQMPRDWYSGSPLRYARQAEGSYLLYSVGADGHDDKGDPRPASDQRRASIQAGRDLVWPAVASADAVAAKPKRLPIRFGPSQ